MHLTIDGAGGSTKPEPQQRRSEKVRTFAKRTHHHKPFDHQRFVSVLWLHHTQLRDLVEVWALTDECSPPVGECSPPVRECSPPVRECSPPVRGCSPPVRECSPPVRRCSSPDRNRSIFFVQTFVDFALNLPGHSLWACLQPRPWLFLRNAKYGQEVKISSKCSSSARASPHVKYVKGCQSKSTCLAFYEKVWTFRKKPVRGLLLWSTQTLNILMLQEDPNHKKIKKPKINWLLFSICDVRFERVHRIFT